MKLTINNRVVDTNSLKLLGTGGEADIYDLGQSMVLKVFKDAKHPDYAGNQNAQIGATERIKVHQQKIIQFPNGLPPQVVMPKDIAYDAKQMVRGYTMRFIPQASTIWTYSQPGSYVRGTDEVRIIGFLKSMHSIIDLIHAKGVVIGDFNDLNILIDQSMNPWFIDADSYQYGNYFAKTFDERFVDPLLCMTATPSTHPQICSDGKSHMMLKKPHEKKSDWYAFTAMVLQTLCAVPPYGGVYRPKQVNNQLPQHLRPMKRISIFNPEVIYPKKARPVELLPDDLGNYFHNVFMKDDRTPMPKLLLDTLRFTLCTNCGTAHARNVCPGCKTFSRQPLTSVFQGTMNASRILRTNGVIVSVSHDDTLRYVYHDGVSYKKDDGTEILRAPHNVSRKFYVSKSYTAYTDGSVLSVIRSDGSKQTYPLDSDQGHSVALSGDKIVFVSGSMLTTEETILGVTTTKKLATVVGGNTDIWTGAERGFGRYRAGEIVRHFIFSPKQKMFYDGVDIPRHAGKLIDSTAYIGSHNIWYFTLSQEVGQRMVRIYVIDMTGKIIAEHVGGADDGTFSGSISGKCVVGNFLLSPSDDGVVRVEVANGGLYVAKTFPDTVRVVDQYTSLLPALGGLIVSSAQEIWHITIK